MVKWCNQVSPTSHKVGLGWVEAATKTFESLALDLVTIKSDRTSITVKSKGLRWQKAEFVLFQATLLYGFLCQAVFVLPEVMSVFGFVGIDPDPEQLAIVDVESVKKKKSQFSTEMKHHNTENLPNWACRVWGSAQALQVCY